MAIGHTSASPFNDRSLMYRVNLVVVVLGWVVCDIGHSTTCPVQCFPLIVTPDIVTVCVNNKRSKMTIVYCKIIGYCDICLLRQFALVPTVSQ